MLDKYHMELKNHNQLDAASVLNISCKQLQKVLKKGAEMSNEAVAGHSFKVKDALYDLFLFLKSRNMSVNSTVICQKAKLLAKESSHLEYKQWFTRWKKQHDITFVTLKEEAAEADVKSAERFVTESVPELLKTFPEENIWNADGTGIYFNVLPDFTYVRKDKKKDKRGFKVAKEQVIILVCCSMAGEKQFSLFIGNLKTPHCLRNMNPPMPYNFSENSWMTRQIWKEWPEDLDQQMRHQNRDICFWLTTALHTLKLLE